MRQLRRTYDPPGMTAEQLVGALPVEFDRWKEKERSSAGRAASKGLAALRRAVGMASTQ
jgi:hypothetical protein